jgi:class 3 adenylate cyclase/tetratricopeptide (TPR) repeat protein
MGARLEQAGAVECACGQANPAGARFCLACGEPLGRIPAVAEERKVVSVLFVDLVGFTSRAEQLDPEDVHSLLEPYWEHVRDELERHSGTVEKFVGDAVVALFGAPAAHEDDAERAVRAGLAIRDWARRSADVDVRVGIATGEALVRLGARPDSGEVVAIGDVVNTAARLEQAAPVDGVLVDQATHEATREAIELTPAAAVEAKGKRRPVQAWHAIGVRRDAASSRHESPFVGRATELELLRGILRRVVAEGTPQLVTIVGPPGIGKTRIVRELRRGADAEWLEGRALPYGDGTTLWALAQVVKRYVGILESDSPERAASKVIDTARSLLDASEVDAVAERVRALVGLAGSGPFAPDRRAESFSAWRRLFEEIARRGPLVLLFEDLQWADDTLLEFLDHLLEWASGHPILVLCTGRPELLREHPAWGSGKPNALTLTLPPLTDGETAGLLGTLLGRDAAEVATELRDQTGGNPLYVEQFARMLAEGGEHELLPRTVEAVIGARIDELPAGEKRVLEDAAVAGSIFWPGAVAAIGQLDRVEVEALLHELERSELVVRRHRSTIEAEPEHAFRHGLVCDVAYARIPRAARVEKHRRAAEWLESVARPQDHAETLAHHYVRALEAARAGKLDTAALEQRTRLALRQAAERALAIGGFAAAARYLRSALELWPADDPERPRVLLRLGCALWVAEMAGEPELLAASEALTAAGDREGAAEAETMLSELRWHRGERAQAWAHLEQALRLVEDTPDSPPKAFALARLARQLMLAGAYEEAIRSGRDALALAERFELDELRVSALNSIGSARSRAGDEEGLADVERALEIAVAIGTPAAEVAYNNLASGADDAGDLRRSTELLHEARKVAERTRDRSHLAWSDRELAARAYHEGRWEELDAFVTRLDASQAEGHYLDALVHCKHALMLHWGGEADAAAIQAERGEAEARHVGEPQLLLPCLADCALVHLLGGRREEAAELVDEVVAAAERGGYLPPSASFELAAVLVALDRASDLVALLDGLGRKSTWFDAARALADGDGARAAELYEQIGSRPAADYACAPVSV